MISLAGALAELEGFARVGVGTPRVVVPVNVAVDEAVAAARREVRGREIVVDLRSERSVELPGDALQQVVNHLLRNALQATSAGGKVYVSASDEPDGNVRVTIRDEGPGIPEPHAERIFYPYYTTGRSAGNGMGLAMSRRIIEHAGGALVVEPDTGVGATFAITLPAAKRLTTQPSWVS
jgi:signal transduction histidine kinase